MNPDNARLLAALLGGFHDEVKRLEAEEWRIPNFIQGDPIRFSVGTRMVEVSVVDEDELAGEMADKATQLLATGTILTSLSSKP